MNDFGDELLVVLAKRLRDAKRRLRKIQLIPNYPKEYLEFSKGEENEAHNTYAAALEEYHWHLSNKISTRKIRL